MVPILDTQIRFLLLSHVVTHLRVNRAASLPGIDPEQMGRLQTLSLQEFVWLAATRDIRIDVSVDPNGLDRALRMAPRVGEAEWLKTYFITHGASWQLMRDLFKLRRKIVLSRRRELGAWCPPGRMVLPDDDVRARIRDSWKGMAEKDLRIRYYRLHQTYRSFRLRVLEEVVRGERRER